MTIIVVVFRLERDAYQKLIRSDALIGHYKLRVRPLATFYEPQCHGGRKLYSGLGYTVAWVFTVIVTIASRGMLMFLHQPIFRTRRCAQADRVALSREAAIAAIAAGGGLQGVPPDMAIEVACRLAAP
jgi:hypothetical protein